MTDVLDHRTLTSRATRVEAITLAADIASSYSDTRNNEALLAALASAFRGICDYMDVDPDAAFAQVSDALESEEMTVSADEMPADVARTVAALGFRNQH